MEIPFDNPLFLIPVSTGLIFLAAGWFMLKFPPKEINGLYGYRTKNSMKNQERWDFSQKFAAKEMMKLAVLLILSGLLGFIELSEILSTIIGLSLMMLLVVLLIVRVEAAIKSKFGKD